VPEDVAKRVRRFARDHDHEEEEEEEEEDR
jgi:hypothetical protein